MLSFAFGIVFLVGAVTSSSLTTTLTHAEQQRIIQQLKQISKHDLLSIYYSVTALHALGKEISDVENLCSVATSQLKQDDAQSLFCYSEVVKTLKCKNVPSISFDGLITDTTDTLTFSHIIVAMRNLGTAVDKQTVKKFVAVAKDSDDPLSAAASFRAASYLPKSDSLKPLVSIVEDIVAQADEISGQVLQFEGGLATTSSVVLSIIKLSEQQGSALLKEDQVVKFTQYFLKHKYVYSLKDIHHSVLALSALANNAHQVPVAVSVFKSSLITKENPSLKVRVTNVLDRSIPDVEVSVKSFTTADEVTTLFDNKKFTKTTAEDDYIVVDGDVARGYIAAHSFGIDVMAADPSRGMFKCNILVKVNKGSKQFLASGSYVVGVKVLARIMVEDVEISVGDKDQSNLEKSVLSYPDKLSKALQADYHQKLIMTFNLKDINGGHLVTAHQTFIRLVHETTGQEIFFVAEADSSDHYKFTLDVGATGKDSFNNLSGKYKMSLIVGDATMQVPISWTLAEVTLTFSGKPKKTKRHERVTQPQPNIEHMFRVPDKRPAKLVSIAFTFLVLSPLLIMLGLWAKIGVNLSNLTFSLPTLLFHLGLFGIFGLYYMFWIQFNMFHTLKLLCVIGGLTFLGGNKMLADMAAAKYKA